jgi:hypothetical protein
MKTILAPIDEKLVLKTPAGTCLYAFVLKPDTKFDSFGVYRVSMTFDDKVEKEFLAEMTDLFERSIEQTRIEKHLTIVQRSAPPWKQDKNGKTVFTFKLRAGGVSDGKNWSNKPPRIYDSTPKRIYPDPETFSLGNGSIIKVFFRAKPFFVQSKAGLTLRLAGVQIIEHHTYDEIAAFGIEPENGGFRFEDDPALDIEKDLTAPPPPPLRRILLITTCRFNGHAHSRRPAEARASTGSIHRKAESASTRR